MDFAWPDVRDAHTLVIGLGGGADVVTAVAVAGLLDLGATGRITIANTKSALDPDLVTVSAHIGRVPPGPTPPRCTTTLERSLPEPPLVVASARGAPLEPLVDEVSALGFDRWIGVDTGGDVLDRRGPSPRGRDQRMLDVLCRSGRPGLLLVVAPGSDGQTATSRLADALADAADPLGAASVAPLIPTYRAFADRLEPHRTPRVVLDAWDRPDVDPVEVPRGARPRIPRAWLVRMHAYRRG